MGKRIRDLLEPIKPDDGLSFERLEKATASTKWTGKAEATQAPLITAYGEKNAKSEH